MLPQFHFHTSRTGPSARAWSATMGTPSLLLCAYPTKAYLLDLHSQQRRQHWSNNLDALDWLSNSLRTYTGRWAGYLSYDIAYLLENIGARAIDDLKLPLAVFGFFPAAESAPLRVAPLRVADTAKLVESRLPYESAVAQCKAYIAAGDVFQINLAQRFTIPTALSARQIYDRLLQATPASYGAMLDFGNFALISNSPELFVEVQPLDDGQRRILTRPIKGTRQRGEGMESALRDSLKDQAELNMIIDLERNDLGRICQIGSVRVSQPRTIEAHPTVYHGVATIEGMLRPEVNFLDILRATFPGGSVTGAPKIRAMQIIDELEPVRRGPYCGAIGYLDSDGSMQFNLAIRTIVLKDGQAHISVGGGIVADSHPPDEYTETLVKAQAMFRALGITE